MAKKTKKPTPKASKATAKATPKPKAVKKPAEVVAPTEVTSSIPKVKHERKWLIIASAIFVALIFVGMTYGFISTRNQLNDLKNPSAKSSTEAGKLVAKLSKTVALPANATPTLATVKDASKLKNQAFFVNAQNGDKVLIYQDYSRALLYRPSTGKIIEFSQVSLTGNN